MKKWKISMLIYFLLLCSTFAAPVETTILKNAVVFLPDGKYQENSFIILKGCKIAEIGLMKTLDERIFDNEYNLQGNFVYPAFIDPFYRGFQEKKEEEEERDKDAKEPGSLESKDRGIRDPFEKRNFFIKRKVLDIVQIKKADTRKLIAGGFALLHVVPDKGVINGASGVISLVSENLTDAVITAEQFMFLPFKTNNETYPTTHAALLAELKQLKEDSLYHHKRKELQFIPETGREKYNPELDILLPYFTGEKRFLIAAKNIVEQRMIEILRKELEIDPVIVVSPDAWRRKIDPGVDIILPLLFKPPVNSRYNLLGDTIKKEAQEKIYPGKIAEFFKTHPGICLTAPDSGDYKALFDNIRMLLKQGISETAVIAALTVNPARLLGISRLSGEIKPGLLANLVVSDKKIFEEKTKISRVFVEGTPFDFKTRVGDGKPPVTDLSGTWKVKIESTLGSFDLKMILEQEGNDLTGTITVPMGGAVDIENGCISGDAVSFTVNIDDDGQTIMLEVAAVVKDKKIDGTITIGSFGEGAFAAVPENN